MAIGLRLVWLCQAVLDSIYLADHIEAHLPRVCCVPVAGLLGEVDAVVSQDRVDAMLRSPTPGLHNLTVAVYKACELPRSHGRELAIVAGGRCAGRSPVRRTTRTG